jgi:hypothetical protein
MNTTERFEKVNIDRLVPYARNARTHSKEQILQLRVLLGSLDLSIRSLWIRI